MNKTSAALLGAVTGAALTVIFIGLMVPFAPDEQIRRFGAARDRAKADFVERRDDARLVDAAIQGMMGTLDRFSSYMNPTAFPTPQMEIGDFMGGLGIELAAVDGVVKVVSSISGGPAEKAGVMAGDFITHLDDASINGFALDRVIDRMRGPVASTVKVTILRQSAAGPIELTLVRDWIRVQSVRFRSEGDEIGYVRIAQFNEQTGAGLKQALNMLSAQVPAERLKGFVLDLRNNPGGLFDQAISVADAFLEAGPIVSTRGRSDEDAQRFDARPGDFAKGRPVIVLINRGSAGAAEIVAGALQDHRRAILIGSRSFGKGSAQTIIPLAPSYGGLILTTARCFTPSGRSIEESGIAPDIEVAEAVPRGLDPNDDRPLRAAYDLLRNRTDPRRPAPR
jgi:carboxyl-terminal processing protease